MASLGPSEPGDDMNEAVEIAVWGEYVWTPHRRRRDDGMPP
jgi:hypothetical protein